MRSNERPAFARAHLIPLLILIVAVAAVAPLRAHLFERYRQVKDSSDTYALPAPEQMVVASLGYRSALADILFVSTVISYGLHLQEKRRFEYVGNYLDVVTTLDPTFRTPFMYADTLLVMQTVPARYEDYVKARELLERGMKAFPQDAELWLSTGQFMAYLAAPYMPDKQIKAQWKLDGARVLAKACEFVSSNENIPYHCITAASLLSDGGQREASIRFLERVLAVTEDEEIRRMATNYLERLFGEARREQAERRHKLFRERWSKDLRFVSRDLLLVIGPHFDSARCAGQAIESAECATSWRVWSKTLPDPAAP